MKRGQNARHSSSSSKLPSPSGYSPSIDPFSTIVRSGSTPNNGSDERDDDYETQQHLCTGGVLTQKRFLDSADDENDDERRSIKQASKKHCHTRNIKMEEEERKEIDFSNPSIPTRKQINRYFGKEYEFQKSNVADAIQEAIKYFETETKFPGCFLLPAIRRELDEKGYKVTFMDENNGFLISWEDMTKGTQSWYRNSPAWN